MIEIEHPPNLITNLGVALVCLLMSEVSVVFCILIINDTTVLPNYTIR